jgi:hypothetical protein
MPFVNQLYGNRFINVKRYILANKEGILSSFLIRMLLYSTTHVIKISNWCKVDNSVLNGMFHIFP